MGLACSPYSNVEIRDELLFLNELSSESLNEEIYACSSEILGEVSVS